MNNTIVRAENIQHILKLVEPSFKELAKAHGAVDFRKEASFAMQALNDNDYLMSVAAKNQDSFKRSVINVAAIGLSLNPVLKLAYLIPRKNKVCLDISYMGLVSLAVDGGSIKWAVAELVHEKDFFQSKGVGMRPAHEYNPFGERGKVIGAYCVAKTGADEFITVIMSAKEIFDIRARSESYRSGKPGPWTTDESEMIKKTVIRRASKSWPKANTYSRIEKVLEVEAEDDPALLATPVLDTAKRREQFETVRHLLMTLNIDEDYYIKETLVKITRRKIECFEELTDIEIDQILIQLGQMAEERPKHEKHE